MIKLAEVDSLGRDGVLDAVVSARVAADRHEAVVLVLAAHFADLHPVPVGATGPGSGGVDLVGERVGRLAGVGTPEVAEFAPLELGAALGIGGEAARRLIGDALELRHRLPKLWALVLAGRLQVWKARAVAAETTGLSAAAVGFVDGHVSVIAGRNRIPGPGPLRALIHEALLRCDPEVAAGREQAALDRRGVWTSHRESTATTTITIVAETPDALAFDTTIGQVATTLAALGDPDGLDVRRARAVGVLADPQRSLDLLTGTTTGTPTTPGTSGIGKVAAVLHLHLDADPGEAGGLAAVGVEERYGALTRDLIAGWLHRADQVTIRPVLDMRAAAGPDPQDTGPAAGYTPPASMAERVRLRDRTCVFPDCTRPARACDLDHITPYPDGSTRPENLAPLCRRDHRAKTHGHWHYQRHPEDGSYTWTSPTGRHYTVDPPPGPSPLGRRAGPA